MTNRVREQRTSYRAAPLLALLVTLASGVFAATGAADKRPGVELKNTILSHVRERLPPSQARAVDFEESRVWAFANNVVSMSIYRTEPGQLEAAAIAAIDSGSGQAATASALVRAAMAGVLNSIGHGAQLLPPLDTLPHEARHTSFHDTGNIRVVTVPTFESESMCGGFKHYVDFSKSSVSAVVLDLRGNQGGALDAVVCLASNFLKPGLPLLVIASMRGPETLRSRDIAWHPISLPVVVFIDRETDSGALGLAAALQDQHRARIIGEQKEKINGNVMSFVSTPKGQDMFLLPVADIRHVGGERLAVEGVRVDVAVRANDEDAMTAAASTALEEAHKLAQ